MTAIENLNIIREILIDGGDVCFFCDAKLIRNVVLSKKQVEALNESFFRWSRIEGRIGRRKICKRCYEDIKEIK